MKTINEETKEFIDSFKYERYADKLIALCFKAGVNFAQRWIPVDEELPEGIAILMIENCNIDVVVGYYQNGKWICRLFVPTGISDFEINDKVTHWRPIELI